MNLFQFNKIYQVWIFNPKNIIILNLMRKNSVIHYAHTKIERLVALVVRRVAWFTPNFFYDIYFNTVIYHFFCFRVSPGVDCKQAGIREKVCLKNKLNCSTRITHLAFLLVLLIKMYLIVMPTKYYLTELFFPKRLVELLYR
jgi:hypothetical protein